MNSTTMEIAQMLEMLPQEEQMFACELVKKLVRAWDPDYTKLTPQEAIDLKLAHEQAANGDVYSDDEIDWDNLDKTELA